MAHRSRPAGDRRAELRIVAACPVPKPALDERDRGALCRDCDRVVLDSLLHTRAELLEIVSRGQPVCGLLRADAAGRVIYKDSPLKRRLKVMAISMALVACDGEGDAAMPAAPVVSTPASVPTSGPTSVPPSARRPMSPMGSEPTTTPEPRAATEHAAGGDATDESRAETSAAAEALPTAPAPEATRRHRRRRPSHGSGSPALHRPIGLMGDN